MTKVGYARVSSVGQKLDIQLQKLQEAGCTKIYKEKVSAKSNNRPELDRCLDYIREDDVLVITKLDRLARSLSHLMKIVEILKEKDVSLQVLDQSLDTTSPTGKLTFHVLGAVAEFENEIRKERQLEGIKNSTKKAGRKEKFSKETIEAIANDRDNLLGITEIMKKYNISKASVYRLTNNLVNK